ncbi:MAG: tRNA (adenosine(37)-N6)-threonylcarbamoyltransferase complex transferase subunit TsaD [Leptospiraceae bacterium]|nr:tRNA (adenosine(37)-N6)-threonylcarbamoyltransferase complex transferase subunit TsaD [Leptospiraceae bacterium]MCP5511300.1 tRNA (adenosine(37)-N6)-threonylcarbamoyltransferase complex transferase subunit TsaD [Leptospiraceae bacterium]
MIGLGIESSCDETSIAIVENGHKLRSLQIFSQIEMHTKFRGVVPELASRAHLEKINSLLDRALKESGLELKEIDYISFANRPGLVGSLMIGAQMARVLSFCLNKPIITVDHLEAHLSAIQLEGKKVDYPYLGLLLSGGNSAIFLVEGPGKMKTIADTLDDALGECFDKASSILDLPYPGGPVIEKFANQHRATKGEKKIFPKLLPSNSPEIFHFSYSGLKTSVLYYVQKHPGYKENLPEICYYFQESAFELVVRNCLLAIERTGVRTLVAAGGVLANETLRKKIKNVSLKKNFSFHFPEKKIYCTDNGAMVACLAYHFFTAGKFSSLDFPIAPSRENF